MLRKTANEGSDSIRASAVLTHKDIITSSGAVSSFARWPLKINLVRWEELFIKYLQNDFYVIQFKD
jgi:hypothetical protein